MDLRRLPRILVCLPRKRLARRDHRAARPADVAVHRALFADAPEALCPLRPFQPWPRRALGAGPLAERRSLVSDLHVHLRCGQPRHRLAGKPRRPCLFLSGRSGPQCQLDFPDPAFAVRACFAAAQQCVPAAQRPFLRCAGLRAGGSGAFCSFFGGLFQAVLVYPLCLSGHRPSECSCRSSGKAPASFRRMAQASADPLSGAGGLLFGS